MAARDPIERFVTELRRAGLWDDARHEAPRRAVEERLERIIERALAREVDPAAALDHVVAVATCACRGARRDRRRSAPSEQRAPTTRPVPTDVPTATPGELSWRA